jgi:hypothetical protein
VIEGFQEGVFMSSPRQGAELDVSAQIRFAGRKAVALTIYNVLHSRR